MHKTWFYAQKLTWFYAWDLVLYKKHCLSGTSIYRVEQPGFSEWVCDKVASQRWHKTAISHKINARQHKIKPVCGTKSPVDFGKWPVDLGKLPDAVSELTAIYRQFCSKNLQVRAIWRHAVTKRIT